MALTPKQVKFCECIVSGMSGKDAYYTAYDTKCKDTVAYNESSKLLLREDIQDKITAMRKPLERAAQIKALSIRDEQIDYIKQRIAVCESNNDETSIIRYTEMLNRLYNLYKETETDKQAENNIDNLDISALQKLSGIA